MYTNMHMMILYYSKFQSQHIAADTVLLFDLIYIMVRQIAVQAPLIDFG